MPTEHPVDRLPSTSERRDRRDHLRWQFGTLLLSVLIGLAGLACTAGDARDASGAGSIVAALTKPETPEAAAAFAASEARFEEVRIAMEARRADDIAAGRDPGPIGKMPLREWVYGALGVALPDSIILAYRQKLGLEEPDLDAADLLIRAALKVAVLRSEGKGAKEIALALQRDGLAVYPSQVELLDASVAR